MWAFVVFYMMGFFPVTPGIPVYNIGSPVFIKVSISLPNGKQFTIRVKNSSTNNKYIKSATLNGKLLDKPWFTHTNLLQGAVFDLNDVPNKTWSSKAADPPPSSVAFKPGN